MEKTKIKDKSERISKRIHSYKNQESRKNFMEKKFYQIILFFLSCILLLTLIVDTPVQGTEWSLVVTDIFANKITYTYSQLVALPSITESEPLFCYGNLVTDGNWTGVSLTYLLQQLGINSSVVSVNFLAADGYTVSLPIQQATQPDVIVAYQLNGQPLSETLRLVVPNGNGNLWISMLLSITMSTAAVQTSQPGGEQGPIIPNLSPPPTPTGSLQPQITPTPATNTTPPPNATQLTPIPPSTIREDWPMFRHDEAHTGSNSPTTSKNIQPWNYTTGNFVYSSAAIDNGIIYFGSEDNKIYALNASSGKQIWNFTTGGSVFSSPAISNDILYEGSYDHKIYALNTANGKEIWEFATGNIVVSSPAVVNGVVYVGSNDNKIYALNATSGAQIWDYKTLDFVRSSPAVENGIVYVGSNDVRVYALNATNGGPIWNYTIGSAVVSSPAIVNGVVYIGSVSKTFFALNATDGTQIWNHTTGNSIESSPAIVEGVVYFGSSDGKVYALNAVDGKELWNFSTKNAIVSSPEVVNGVVYVGSGDNKIYALHASDGTLIWNYTTGGSVFSSPTIANGLLYIGSYDHQFYAISAHEFSGLSIDYMIVASAIMVALTIVVIFALIRRKTGKTKRSA